MCDPAYGGGASGIVAGASTTIICALPFAPNEEEALTQVTVNMVEEPSNTSTSVTGPVFCEIWLRRGAGLNLLLDNGNVMGGFQSRNAVGGIGKVGYSDGDYLQINLINNSAATISGVNINYATEKWPSGPDAYKSGCQGWDRFNP